MKEFLAEFFMASFKIILIVLFSFAVGTGAFALVCWYYELPMFLSIFGGILVLGLFSAFKSFSIFDL